MKILEYLYKLSAPEFIRGVVIGISISIVFAMLMQLNTLLNVLGLLLGVLIVLILGVILGNYIIISQKEKLKDEVEEKAQGIVKGILNITMTLVSPIEATSKKENLEKIFSDSKLKKDANDLLKIAYGAVLRFLSLGTLITVLGGAVSFAIFLATYMQVKQIEKQNKLIDTQTDKIEVQSYLLEADRRGALIFLMSNVMDKVDSELKDTTNKSRSLSDELIGRISALSISFKPYKYFEDTLTAKNISPEKGQLLISLLNSNLQKETYNKIFRSGNFRASELKNIALLDKYFTRLDLSNSDLSGARLCGSNLDQAVFDSCNLSNSDFSRYSEVISTFDRDTYEEQIQMILGDSTLCSKASFINSNLSKANLTGADLSLANFSHANLTAADLNDTLENYQFYRERSINRKYLAVNLENADFSNAILKDADLSGADLREANFTNAILENGNLSRTDLSGVILKNADLTNVNLDSAYFTCGSKRFRGKGGDEFHLDCWRQEDESSFNGKPEAWLTRLKQSNPNGFNYIDSVYTFELINLSNLKDFGYFTCYQFVRKRKNSMQQSAKRQ